MIAYVYVNVTFNLQNREYFAMSKKVKGTFYTQTPISRPGLICWMVTLGLMTWGGFSYGKTLAIKNGFDPDTCPDDTISDLQSINAIPKTVKLILQNFKLHTGQDPECVASILRFILQNFQLPTMIGFYGAAVQVPIELRRLNCLRRVIDRNRNNTRSRGFGQQTVLDTNNTNSQNFLIRHQSCADQSLQGLGIFIKRAATYAVTGACALLPTVPMLLSLLSPDLISLDPDVQLSNAIDLTVVAMLAITVLGWMSLKTSEWSYQPKESSVTLTEANTEAREDDSLLGQSRENDNQRYQV